MENITIETTKPAAAVQPGATKTKSKKASKILKACKKAKLAKKAPAAKKADRKPAAERGIKKAEVIALMKRAKGATLAEIMVATQWLPHTVRGFVSILGSKGGEKIESTKNAAGDRTYRIDN